jgi:hypothetical protein
MNPFFIFIFHPNTYFFMFSGIPPADEKKDYLVKGNIKSYYEYYGDATVKNGIYSVIDKTTYEYLAFNPKGQFTSRYYVINENKNSSTATQYNQKGYRTVRFNFGKDSVLTDSTRFIYDFSKNICTSFRYSIETGTIHKNEYVYNEKGDLVKELDYMYDGINYQTLEFTYDNKGNVIKKTEYERNLKLDNYRIYTYDKYNNKITEKVYDSADNLTKSYTYQYKYDTKHNWSTQVKFNDDVPISVYERKIEYY